MTIEGEGFPLSPTQRRVWAFHASGAGEDLCAVARIGLAGALDVECLGRALELVSDKHEALRTTVADGRQLVADDATSALDVVAAGETVPADVERGATAARATLLRRAADEHELVIALPAWSADHASLVNLRAELADAYASLAGGAAFDDEAMQYVDVAEWLAELVASDESRPGRQHWSTRAPRFEDDVRLPFERPESASFAPVAHATELPAAAWRQVRAAADAAGVAPDTFVLAAFGALAARLSGSADVQVAVGADGRRFEELAEPLGPLSGYAPLSVPADPDRTFGELLAHVATERRALERWLECFAWPSGDGPDVPHLGLGFDWRRRPAPVDAAGVTFVLESARVRSERFRCRLIGEESDDAVRLTLDYDPGAFDARTIERLAGQLETLLASAAADPERALRALDVLSAAEPQTLLVDFNATDADYPRDVCIHAFFEEHARRTPDHVAVRHGERALTYAELDARANQLAHNLREHGVGPDTLVTMCVERSVEMIVAIFGILKAGGAYVPIDPAYPADRIQFLVEDTRAPVLVTTSTIVANAQGLDVGDAALVQLDRDAAAIAARPTTAPECGVRPEHLVYVIYTSGSTGKPKGVVITHEKLVISNTARVNHFGHVPRTFLLMSSVAFDSSVVGIFWTLCGGGTLELIPEHLEGDLSRLPEVVADRGVSHLLTLPSVYRLLLDNAEPGQLDELRCVIVAGEACPLKMVDRHRALLPGVALHSEYGATETTVWASVYDCLAQTLPIAPVGHPIENAQMYVLDAELSPCPIGVPGEVHFGGIALAVGYWRRPELTAERFVPDPFRAAPGARLYRSGHLARHLENGDVEFLGRVDNQVKVRGFRIELEEIEVGLLKHPDVKETCVLAPMDEDGDRRLIGYFVPEPGREPELADLRAWLAESLPEFMIPGVIVSLPDFPRTPNGKVDRQALPEPAAERSREGEWLEAPTNPAEAALATIWKSVLRLGDVSVDDNLFELGGDSILSIQIVTQAKKAGFKLTPRQLFENQTIAALARVAEPLAGAAGATGAATAPEPDDPGGPLPLTPVQHWFFELDVPARAHWSMPLVCEVHRPIDPEHLERAARMLVRHHDALRLRFAHGPEGWTQEVVAPSDVEDTELVFVEDLSGVAAPDRPRVLAERAAPHHAALDLERGRLARWILFDAGPGEPQHLVWIVHHLAVDGVSYRILIEDLEQALSTLEAGGTPARPARTTSFARWARQLAAHADTDAAAADESRWAELAPVRVPALPFDRPNGRDVEALAAHVDVELTEDETSELLTSVPKAYGAQVADVLVCALTEALAAWTGETELYLGIEGHGREEERVDGVDLSRTVGWFTTDYPLSVAVARPFEPERAMAATRAALERVPGRGFGFGVARYLRASERLAAFPRPQVGFNYLGQFDQAFHPDGRFRYSAAATGASHDPNGERVFALEAIALVSGGRLRLTFDYGSGRHDRATIERLAAETLSTLRALVTHAVARSGSGAVHAADELADFGWDASALSGIATAIAKTRADAESGDGGSA